MEAAVCYRNTRVLPDLEKHFFVDGMKLRPLIDLHAELETSGGIAEMLPAMYSRAEQKGLPQPGP